MWIETVKCITYAMTTKPLPAQLGIDQTVQKHISVFQLPVIIKTLIEL
uniref:Uncharacterized protein n=1 Tax=Anguilla anguilla TaxID=7936 RepID=A0A0E9TYW3_ANGAN